MSVAAFLDGITKRFGGIVGRLKVFRVARYDDQQGIAAVALPCFEEQLGFVCAFVHARAGADDDGSCADAFFKGGGKRARVVGGRDVVFGVAANVDVGRADKVQALGISSGLGKAAGEALHSRLDQLADFEVAALGFFGEASVGQKRGMPASWQPCIRLGQISVSIKMPQMGRCSAKNRATHSDLS